MAIAPRARIARLLRNREPVRIPDHRTERRAAVALLLRDPAGRAGGDLSALEALFVLRAERDGDPWSGQVGLPGGHWECGDADLGEAALRELREETGLGPGRGDLLGRLDEIHPRSRRLPSVAVTPFVVWHSGVGRVRAGPEVADHFWVPLGQLEDPDRRSVLTVRRGRAYRAFPAIEYADHTIWGLTFAIVTRFLDLLPRKTSPEEAPPDGRTRWPTR